ncbi:hypothetical protein C2U72_26420 [Prosthecomicrobium hirschii]|uniref:hypothetical protein n=1 Tax=Prosthecodimorpha hirschii TaxID=665126 RepID=UPI00112C8545|nr:hypothetical protein [Prosthecomicrobium hirschii]TPQ45740.1 hypothetical protein C2U72_26420 [Prosthecomicrobium hirschii]
MSTNRPRLRPGVNILPRAARTAAADRDSDLLSFDEYTAFATWVDPIGRVCRAPIEPDGDGTYRRWLLPDGTPGAVERPRSTVH